MLANTSSGLFTDFVQNWLCHFSVYLSTTGVPGMKADTESYWHAGIRCLAVEACEIPGRSCSVVRSSCLWHEQNQDPTDGFLKVQKPTL